MMIWLKGSKASIVMVEGTTDHKTGETHTLQGTHLRYHNNEQRCDVRCSTKWCACTCVCVCLHVCLRVCVYVCECEQGKVCSVRSVNQS